MPRTAKNKKAVPVRWVSKDEFSAMVDSRAKRVLGVSARQLFLDGKKDSIVN